MRARPYTPTAWPPPVVLALATHAPAGTTYVISTKPYDGWAKIGRTTGEPAKRLKSCQTGNARELLVRSVWPVDVEYALHEAYREFRGRGEWFALPFAMVEDMARLASKEQPLGELFDAWTPARIWSTAGREVSSPTSLAACFMATGARKQNPHDELVRLRGELAARDERIQVLEDELSELETYVEFDQWEHEVERHDASVAARTHLKLS